MKIGHRNLMPPNSIMSRGGSGRPAFEAALGTGMQPGPHF
jgi:hypothetical protein